MSEFMAAVLRLSSFRLPSAKAADSAPRMPDVPPYAGGRRTTRRRAVQGGALLLAVAVLPAAQEAEGKYGLCSKCSCPGFFGSSYTCSRRGCGHHYDDHW